MAGLRKQHSSVTKAKVALEAIKGLKTANAHRIRVWSASHANCSLEEASPGRAAECL
jgi:hypothetical protein